MTKARIAARWWRCSSASGRSPGWPARWTPGSPTARRSPPAPTSTRRGRRRSAEQAAAAAEADRARPYEEVEYRAFPIVGSRVAVWVAAQLHLLFAAFVLAVPMFALIIEFIGWRTGDKRYDALAYEFTKLLSTSFSFTASFGALS
jgi:cytochrome bd ubiquinol oxidase subunit I